MKNWSQEDWRRRAACRGMDPALFVRAETDLSHYREGRQVCVTCPVTKDCLDHALVYGEVGLWGNTTDKQRRGIKPSRRPPSVGWGYFGRNQWM